MQGCGHPTDLILTSSVKVPLGTHPQGSGVRTAISVWGTPLKPKHIPASN